MAASEISHLMELNKRKAELEYKRGYVLRKGKPSNDPAVLSMEETIAEVSKQALALESRITVNGAALFYPCETAIAELSAKLSKIRPEDVDKAMETRSGDAYSLLETRGGLVKENYERRKDIAALIEFSNSLPSKIREEIVERVRAGKIGTLDASTLDEKSRAKLFRLLNRSGVPCFLEGYKLLTESKKGTEWREIRVDFNGSHVWVEPSKEEETRKFGKEFVETGNAIQIMNAERQIRKFTPEDEQKFGELQKKYLLLIRKRDELIASL